MNKFKVYAQAYEQRTNYIVARLCRILAGFTNKFREHSINTHVYTERINCY